jgi:hypothetical protein
MKFVKFGAKIVRPAVGHRLNLTIFEINLKFYNTAGVTRMKCGVKFVTPAGLISATAGLIRTKCGVKNMTLDPLYFRLTTGLK